MAFRRRWGYLINYMLARDRKTIMYLFIDTCVWLKLLEKTKFLDILNSLHELQATDKLKIVISNYILEEFNRNKNKIIQSKSKSISKAIKILRSYVNILKNDKRAKANELLGSFEESIGNLNEESEIMINKCQSIFDDDKTICIHVSDEILIKVAKRAFEKQWPFVRNKNNFGDAIHLETVVEFKKDRLEDELYFITYNTEEFSHHEDKTKPHPDIEEIFNALNIKYTIKFPELLENISHQALDEETKQLFYSHAGFPIIIGQEAPYHCEICGTTLGYDGYKVRNGLAGVHWVCPSCNMIFIDLDDSY